MCLKWPTSDPRKKWSTRGTKFSRPKVTHKHGPLFGSHFPERSQQTNKLCKKSSSFFTLQSFLAGRDRKGLQKSLTIFSGFSHQLSRNLVNFLTIWSPSLQTPNRLATMFCHCCSEGSSRQGCQIMKCWRHFVWHLYYSATSSIYRSSAAIGFKRTLPNKRPYEKWLYEKHERKLQYEKLQYEKLEHERNMYEKLIYEKNVYEKIKIRKTNIRKTAIRKTCTKK